MIPEDVIGVDRHNCKPRASGDDPAVADHLYRRLPVNPARAGMIPRAWEWWARLRGKPRASGDDPPFDPERNIPQM